MNSPHPITDAHAGHVSVDRAGCIEVWPATSGGYVPREVCERLEKDNAEYFRVIGELTTRLRAYSVDPSKITNSLLAMERHESQFLRDQCAVLRRQQEIILQRVDEGYEWDEQSLAKQLGARLGDSCRKVISTRVPEVLAENKALKDTLQRVGEVMRDSLAACSVIRYINDVEVKSHSIKRESEIIAVNAREILARIELSDRPTSQQLRESDGKVGIEPSNTKPQSK
jgi:hypothetical protein